MNEYLGAYVTSPGPEFTLYDWGSKVLDCCRVLIPLSYDGPNSISTSSLLATSSPISILSDPYLGIKSSPDPAALKSKLTCFSMKFATAITSSQNQRQS